MDKTQKSGEKERIGLTTGSFSEIFSLLMQPAENGKMEVIMKRIITIVLAIMLALSFTLPVMASGGEEIEELEQVTHTVTFDGNGRGGIIATMEVPEGKTMVDVIHSEEDSNKLHPEVKEGGKTYTVYDWYKNQGCTEQFSFWNTKINDNITVYAKWVECVSEVEIDIDVPKDGDETHVNGDDNDILDFFDQTNRPNAKITKGNCEIYKDSDYNNTAVTAWIDIADFSSFNSRLFDGKFKTGHGCYAYLALDSFERQTVFAKETKIKVNGITVPQNQVYWDGDFLDIFAMVRLCFSDVPLTHNFQEHVYWAVDNDIAAGYSGTGSGKFGVADNITRGQVLMFLWRAAGKPEPQSDKQTFKDVKTDNGFYKAIQWAVEQKITNGYSGDKKGYFGPNDKCTRGQIATFLWKYNGSPNPKSNKKTFTDVPVTHSYYKAIQWASEQKITSGYSDNSFGVKKNCTRGQCVTFLHRMLG